MALTAVRLALYGTAGYGTVLEQVDFEWGAATAASATPMTGATRAATWA